MPSIFYLCDKFDWSTKLTNKLPSSVTGGQGIDAISGYVSPIVQCVSAIVNAVTSAVYSHANESANGSKATDFAIAGAVLGNLSFIGAPLGNAFLAASSEDATVAAKTIIDLLGNAGAAFCIFDSTSLWPK